jgi:organic radical activating enzyme
MIVALTSEYKFKKISLSKLKDININFKDWHCPIQNWIILASHTGLLKSGVCGEIILSDKNNPWWEKEELTFINDDEKCSFKKNRCFCNADLKTPKSKTKEDYEYLIKNYQSSDHLIEINNDEIIGIMWQSFYKFPEFEVHLDIGKKCNFDCSYCSDDIHDNFSPFIEIEKIKKLVLMCDSYTMDKKKVFVLTGGEPTLYKNFNELMIFLNEKSFKVMINTNGTFKQENIEYFLQKFKDTGIVLIISIHQEFTNAKHLNKFNYLKNKYPNNIEIKFMGNKNTDFYSKVISIIPEKNFSVMPIFDKKIIQIKKND